MRWMCTGILLLSLPAFAVERLELVTTFQAAAMVRIDDHQHRLSLDGPDVDGVRLVGVSGDEVDLAVDDKLYHLSPGVVKQLGSGHGASRVVVAMNQLGQYVTAGSINDSPVDFLVDTGANTVVMNQAQAEHLRLDYRSEGQRGEAMTAGGRVTAWYVLLHHVRVGRIELDNVGAVVVDNKDGMGFILLGMSFLDRVRLTHEARHLVLQTR